MNTGRAVILNPSRPDSVKRREFLLDSLRKSGLEWSEEIEDSRITITWQGEPKRTRTRTVSTAHKVALPPPVTLEKALRSRFNCDPDDVEYWDEMIRLTAERESAAGRENPSPHEMGHRAMGRSLGRAGIRASRGQPR